MRGVALSRAWMTARGTDLQFLAAVVSPFLQPPLSQGSSSSFLVQLFLITMFGAVFLSFAALLLESLCSVPHPDAQPDADADADAQAQVQQAEARRTAAVEWLRLNSSCLLILAFVSQFLMVRKGVTRGAGWRDLMLALLVVTLVPLCLWLASHSRASAARTKAAAAAALSLAATTASATAAMDTDFPAQPPGQRATTPPRHHTTSNTSFDDYQDGPTAK